MNYGNLTDDLLDYPFFLDSYDDHPNTLREYLEYYGEDILNVNYKIVENNNGEKTLDEFLAWSEDSVFFLNLDLFNARIISKVPRHPLTHTG